MLPSRPNARAVGLPSGPRSGIGPALPPSRSRTPIPSSSSAGASYLHTRPQELAPRERDRARSKSRPRPQQDNSDTRSEPGGSFRKSDDSTASSSVSSVFDRLKNGSEYGGYSSSRTSVDEEREIRPGRGNTLRGRPKAQSQPPSPTLANESPPPLPPVPTSPPTYGGNDVGYNIWNRVTNVANDLTISVSKAWSSNVATFAGEDTPPGQDSRLTRAMRAYHAEKARSPTDLPEWLFDEHERRSSPVSAPARLAGREANDPLESQEFSRSRGFRDIYDKAAATSATAPVKRPQHQLGPSLSDDLSTPSKATDRLKALRDAKRNAYGVARQEPELDRSARQPEVEEKKPATRTRVRVGLPSRPKAF